MTLGFDASTTCAGYAIFDGKEILEAGFIRIDKFETIKQKALHIIKTIEASPHIASITRINLEAALYGFMGGRTTQQTVIKLARFNAVFEYIITERWSIPVNLLSVTTARKTVLGKARVKGMTGKEYVRATLPKVRPEVLKFEKLNTKGGWDVHNEDMYDAVVIAAA